MSGAGSGGRVPGTLWLAVAGLLCEAAEMLAFTVFLIYFQLTSPGGEATGAIALAVMFAIIAAGLVGLAIGTVRARRWARPASVAWQILLVLSALSGVWGNRYILIALLIPAVITLLGTFLPASVRFYDGRLRAAEAARAAAEESPEQSPAESPEE